MDGGDFEVTASWGYFGSGQAVMPGQGRVVERPYTSKERKAMGDAISTLGDTTLDVYLNERAYWRNVPSNVWSYKLGGYQCSRSGCRTARARAWEAAEAGGGAALRGDGEKGWGDTGLVSQT